MYKYRVSFILMNIPESKYVNIKQKIYNIKILIVFDNIQFHNYIILQLQ